MFCLECEEQVGDEDKFCWHCGYKLENKEISAHVQLRETPQTSAFIKQWKGMETIPKILLILLVIGFIFLIWFLGIIPRDEIIEIGNSSYVLSKEAQKYLEISEVSDYEKSKSIIIIEEPHQDIERQINLYKGLEIFFGDNPTLINETIFLSEGFPSGKHISVQPLIAANSSPNEELIREVLGSYLITGHIAYEWKYQKGIPIIGTENEELYELSARKWIDVQENQDDQNISDIWTYTVIARNGNIANLTIEIIDIYKNPILFIGGLHLHKQNDNDFQRIKNNSVSLTADEFQYLEGWDNSGIYDYLKKENIGYTFIQAKSRSFRSWVGDEKNYDTYTKLFKAQQSGNYDSYIQWLTTSESLNEGVTVRPSVEAAAALVKALAGKGTGTGTDAEKDSGTGADAGTGEKTDQKDDEKNKKEKKNGGDGDGKPRGAEIDGDKLKEGDEISEEEAVEKVKELDKEDNHKEGIKVDTKEQAENIAKKASDGKKPIFEPAHQNGYYDHFHTNRHGGAHVWYGSPQYRHFGYGDWKGSGI